MTVIKLKILNAQKLFLIEDKNGEVDKVGSRQNVSRLNWK